MKEKLFIREWLVIAGVLGFLLSLGIISLLNSL